jgi:hypothetical protein
MCRKGGSDVPGGVMNMAMLGIAVRFVRPGLLVVAERSADTSKLGRREAGIPRLRAT